MAVTKSHFHSFPEPEIPGFQPNLSFSLGSKGGFRAGWGLNYQITSAFFFSFCVSCSFGDLVSAGGGKLLMHRFFGVL